MRLVKNLPIFALLALAMLVSQAATAGSVTGKIVFEGSVPNLKPVAMNADPACAAKHDTAVYPDMLVLGEGNAMANIFVQITGVPNGGHTPPTEPVIIDQNGCMYHPHVAGVMVGQPLQFHNSDGILHNVHGLPKVNREFNIGMPPSLTEKETTFSKPEAVFPVKCDVHPWMQAFVAVMDHPWFDVTGADGTFSIGDVPAGTYEVVAWHERLGTQKASVTVGDGAATADFTFKVPGK